MAAVTPTSAAETETISSSVYPSSRMFMHLGSLLGVLGCDFLAGTVAGIAQVFAGHPLDTIKVRLQTQGMASSLPGSHTPFTGAWHCLRSTLTEEGVRGLYKGVTSPIVGIAAVNAVVFSAYGSALRVMSTNDETPTITQCAVAGGFAGFVNCVVIGPVELLKARMQVQFRNPSPPRYKSPFDCLVKMVRTEGIRSPFRGNVACIYREVPCYMGYFAVYEYLKRYYTTSEGISPIALLMAGGLGGMVGWTLSYPQDLIKSRLQVQPLNGPYKGRFDGGFNSCLRSVVVSEGWRGLWKGFGPCILRSFPTNAITFYTYETVMNLLRNDNV